MTRQLSYEENWHSKARLFALRFNFAWWLVYFLPYFFVLALLFAVILLLLRTHEASLLGAWWLFAFFVLGGGLLHSFIVRKRCITSAQALVQIEWALKLKSGLSAAAAERASWPKPPAQVEDGLCWNLSKALIPFCASLLLLVGASLVPISKKSPVTSTAAAAELPTSITEVESWIEKLERDKVLSEESLEKLKQELEELKSKDPEEWFAHSNLEAADSLKEKTAQELKALLGSLEKIEGALDAAGSDKLSEAERAQAQETLGKALQELKSGEFSPSEGLTKELQALAQNGAANISPEKRVPLTKELREKLKALQQNPATAPKGAKEGEFSESGDSGEMSQGSCSGGDAGPMCMQGREGQGQGETGTGGVDQGPGHAPLNLSEKSPALTSNRSESLPLGSEKKLDPGELLGLSARAPEADTDAKNSLEGGAVGSNGEGGAVTWRNSFTPDEQEVLKAFFK